MGSFDGAELCELAGIYLLSKLLEIIPKDQSGLYRDDGLLLLRKMNDQKTDKIRKQVIQLFKDAGFLLEIETKCKQIDFLDATLNLNPGLHLPYKKPKIHFLHQHFFKSPPSSDKAIAKLHQQEIIQKLIERGSF